MVSQYASEVTVTDCSFHSKFSSRRYCGSLERCSWVTEMVMESCRVNSHAWKLYIYVWRCRGEAAGRCDGTVLRTELEVEQFGT